MLLGSKWRHWWRKDKTAGEKQTWRWGEERTENKGGERGFEMSQNSFTRSLNSLQRCVVYLSPPFLCSQSGLNSPEMFWSNQNHSLTIAVLCHPTALSSVWVDTLLREKSRQKEGDCESMWGEYTLCPSVVFLAGTKLISPVESAMSHCSLWLTSHPGHPTVYICSAELSVKEMGRKGRDRACNGGEKKSFFFTFLHLHPFNLRVQMFVSFLSAFSGADIVFFVFKFGLVNPCVYTISARHYPCSQVVSSWTSQSRQCSCSPILITLFIPGQL